MTNFRPAGATSAYPPGTAQLVVVDGQEVAIFNIDGEFHALDNRCPHRGGPLGAGSMDGATVYCPLHGWGFDVRTGRCYDRPDRPARSYATRIVDGVLEVELCPNKESL